MNVNKYSRSIENRRPRSELPIATETLMTAITLEESVASPIDQGYMNISVFTGVIRGLPFDLEDTITSPAGLKLTPHLVHGIR